MKINKILVIFGIIFNSTIGIGAANTNCLIDKNWYKERRSNLYTKGCMKENPKHIVIHHSIFDNLDDLKQIFEDNNVSCHYFIDNDGNVHNIIKDNCIVYHAGFSYWNGNDGLNNSSICIEIMNDSPFVKDITDTQYDSLIKLLKRLKQKYNIDNYNVVSHSDIAYFNNDFSNGYLNRKQDISHLFSWKKLAKNDVSFWYNEENLDKKNYTILYYFGDEKDELIDIKHKLKQIGYKIENLDNKYDVEFYMLSIVFHRRFFPEQLTMAGQGLWTESSTSVLNAVIKNIKNIIE